MNFNLDMNDERFGALFTSPDFALDPTDPRYKATESTRSIQSAAAHKKGSLHSSKAAPAVAPVHANEERLPETSSKRSPP